MTITQKYAPRKFTDLAGQAEAVETILAYVQHLQSTNGHDSFVFYGDTGIGKSAAARCLAAELGCGGEYDEMAGLHEVPSGQQDGRAVDDLMRLLWRVPLFGSGWKVAIVNEVDGMTPQAGLMWLDALQHLPPRTVIVFTTNDVDALAPRFADRSKLIPFESDAAKLRPALETLIRKIWRQESGRPLRHVPQDLGRPIWGSPNLSFRLALQQIEPYLLTGKPLPARMHAVPTAVRTAKRNETIRLSSAAHKAWATRRAACQA